MRIGWNTPAAWNAMDVSPRPSPLTIIGFAVSLNAISGESALRWIEDVDLEAAGLPDDAYGRFPLTAHEVRPFLTAAGTLVEPKDAALGMTRLLAALDASLTPLQVAYTILDVWDER